MQHHHHHHHHPEAFSLLQDDPTCTTSQETGHCSLLHYAGENDPPFNMGYTVPNFGQDEDVKAALKFAGDAERELGHSWNPPPLDYVEPLHPMDYFVPNFGVDHDIEDTHKHIAAAEEALGHKFNPQLKQPDNSLPVPPAQQPSNRVLDPEVVSTLAHSTAAEEELGHKWNIVWEAQPGMA